MAPISYTHNWFPHPLLLPETSFYDTAALQAFLSVVFHTSDARHLTVEYGQRVTKFSGKGTAALHILSSISHVHLAFSAGCIWPGFVES